MAEAAHPERLDSRLVTGDLLSAMLFSSDAGHSLFICIDSHSYVGAHPVGAVGTGRLEDVHGPRCFSHSWRLAIRDHLDEVGEYRSVGSLSFCEGRGAQYSVGDVCQRGVREGYVLHPWLCCIESYGGVARERLDDEYCQKTDLLVARCMDTSPGSPPQVLSELANFIAHYAVLIMMTKTKVVSMTARSLDRPHSLSREAPYESV